MIELIIINGLVYGGVYAVLTLGFSLVFGVAKLLNLAYTAYYMICGFIIFVLATILGVDLIPSIIVAILITCLLGMISYEVCLARVKEHEVTVLIISVALAILFQELFLLIFGGDYRRIPPFVTGFLEIAGVRVTYQHFIAIGICLITLISVGLLLSKTKLGYAIRAVAQDREIANLMGINVDRVYILTMVISVALAGIACAVVSPIFMVHPLMWVHSLIIVLAAAVLGGLGSIRGSVIAAFILAFTEVAVVTLVPGGSFLRGAVSLGVMIMVLIVKPEGLFGIVFEEERL